jgi:hypothetical protein
VSGIGCEGNHHLKHLVESLFMNSGELSGNDKEGEVSRNERTYKFSDVPGAVRVAIVLRAWENYVQGKGPQRIGVWNAIYLNGNTEVHL